MEPVSLLQDLIASEAAQAHEYEITPNGPVEIDQSERFRLIPTLGTRGKSWFVFGRDAAQQDAERSFTETGTPVLICAFPPDGLCTALYTVGKVDKKKGAKR